MPATHPLGPMVRMREVRNLKGWTLKETAERMLDHGVEISEGGLSNIENGNKPASRRLLMAWAAAFGLDEMGVWQGPLRPKVQPGVPEKVPA